MTISTSASAQIVAGNGVTTTFQFGFIPDSADDVTVTAIASNGQMTLLNSSQYNLLINPPNPNQLWGVGGTVTYPLTGSPLSSGQSLLIQRTLPLTQETSVQNQGNYFAQVTERALDTLCMEIQQVAARTGQMRGTWATGIDYNFGDVVVDGANGNSTGNYYMCAIANTSGVWATDLAAGDWSLAINVQAINASIGSFLPLSGGTISGSLIVTGTSSLSGGASLGGTVTAATQASSDNSTKLATTAYVTSAVSNLGGGSGLILLQTSHVTNAASVAFSSTFINSTYNRYAIKFDAAFCPSGTSFYLTESTNNGASYLGSGYVWGQQNITVSGASVAVTSAVSDVKLPLGSGFGSLGGAAEGTIEFSNPSLSGTICQLMWELQGGNQSLMKWQGGGSNVTTTPINNIKITADSGNLTGSFHLMAYKGT